MAEQFVESTFNLFIVTHYDQNENDDYDDDDCNFVDLDNENDQKTYKYYHFEAKICQLLR